MKKLIALGFVAAIIAAFKFLPLWAGVGTTVALGLLTKLLNAVVFNRFTVGIFEAKSAALRGARARLHGITAAPGPKREFDDEFDDEELNAGVGIEPTPRVWRYIDVTIEVPVPDKNAQDRVMTMWEPGELTIVEPEAKSGKAIDLEGFDADLGVLHSVDAMQGGSWVPLEGDRVLGSQRLRLHVGVRPGADQFKLRYYFEILGNAGTGAA